ncbi:MAG: PadR family transcriptional regulator [bacterium]
MTLPSVGELELAVMLTIARLGANAYGASIRRTLLERTGRDHAVGTVFTTLQRIEAKGLVVSSISEPTAVRGGRAKRCFQLTRLGAQVMQDARQVNAALWKGVPRVTTA